METYTLRFEVRDIPLREGGEIQFRYVPVKCACRREAIKRGITLSREGYQFRGIVPNPNPNPNPNE